MMHRLIVPGSTSLRLITLTILVQFIVIIGRGQVRQVYEDAAAGNEVKRISFYSASEGYVAFRDWIGYTTDSGRTFTKKLITLSNVDTKGNTVNATFGFGIS